MPVTRRHRLLSALVLLAGPLAATACPLNLPELAVSVAEQALTVELAATPRARHCGLSHRDKLPAQRGMLFVFPAPVRVPFWMKDTRIALSIAFLDRDGRILALADMTPLDTSRVHHPAMPYHYALEVNRGWFAQHDVDVGDQVHFELPAGWGPRPQ